MFKLFASLLLALPTLALAAAPPTAGVWKGTLGRSAVIVCINTDLESGSYYYLKYRTPIQLRREGQEWRESGDTGRWELAAPGPADMAGAWRSPKGDTPLPVQLVPVSRGSDPEPCASDAYNAALETLPQLQTGARTAFGEYAYRTLRIADVETLELLSPSPARLAINRQLRNRLPASLGDLDDYFATRRAFLGRMGLAAEDETSAEPVFWNAEFVTIHFYRWVAGFGQNGISPEYLTWDLRSGGGVDLWAWLIDKPMVDKTGRRRPQFDRSPPAPECAREDDGGPEWQLALEADGLRFWQRANGDGCEEEFSIPYERLGPLLSPEGRSAVARLMAARPR